MLQEHLLYEVFGKIMGIWCDLHFSRLGEHNPEYSA
jgi:hypothetical protein